jgi:hypothetical protein
VLSLGKVLAAFGDWKRADVDNLRETAFPIIAAFKREERAAKA